MELGMLELRGSLEAAVLKILKTEKLHGYAIVKKLNEMDQTIFKTGEGTIYPLLLGMEKKNLITSTFDGRRKIYSISEEGGEFLLKLREEWFNISLFMNQLVGGRSL
jgi:DNA-binding PadR family transcriptional regulator